MKSNLSLFVQVVTMAFVLSSCFNKGLGKYDMVDSIINQVKKEYVPDRRVAVFDVKAILDKNSVRLQGETDKPGAIKRLKSKLIEAGFKIRDDVKLLPDLNLNGLIYGVINNSVSNIRSQPKHSAELATQALLGTEVKVLKKEGEWYLVQTPDQYISWIDHGGFVTFDENSYDVWHQSDKVIFLEPVGNVFEYPDPKSGVLGDIVMGCQLKLVGEAGQYYEVQYPDGRIGFVEQSKADNYDSWLAKLERGGTPMIDVALGFKGIPYLWGGTSPKAMDCSGFTKTIYFMNGFVIPRDASQQVNEGLEVDPNLSFEGLEVGDLLFFGRSATDSTKQKTTHVGLWIGDKRFIHSSRNVRISSVDRNSPMYDSTNVDRYLGSKRYLNNLTKGIVDLREKVVL